MSRKSKWEYFKAIYLRYRQAPKAIRQQILDEFCQVCGYHRKYAIRLLGGPPPEKPKPRKRARPVMYGSQAISILAAIWEASGYPWSVKDTAREWGRRKRLWRILKQDSIRRKSHEII